MGKALNEGAGEVMRGAAEARFAAGEASRLEGRTFGDVPLNVEMKLEVWDSPNSAGVVIDAVRMVKLALDRGVSGTLEGPSAYLMKSPPVQYPDDVAHEMTEAFIRAESPAGDKEEERVDRLDGHKAELKAE